MRLAVRAGLLHGALDPPDGIEIHIELMRQETARPDRGGLGIERKPDALAFEILGRADAARIDEDVAVAKDARGKDRQRHERTVAAAHQADEFGRRKLGDVEFVPAHHAVENLAARPQRDAIEVDSLGNDIPFPNGFHPIVAAAGEAQGKAWHGSPAVNSSQNIVP